MLIGKRIPITFILEKIWVELLVVGGFLGGLWGLRQLVVDITVISIPVAVPSVIGTAISLILAFRTNQAYARWWEARKIWGSIVNDSRTWARQVLTLLPAGQAHREVQQRLIYRQILWCYTLGKSLRRDPVFEDNEALLASFDKAEIASYREEQNVPNAILLKQGADIKALRDSGALNSYEHLQIDDTLSRLCDAMGKSERIKNTVFFPKSTAPLSTLFIPIHPPPALQFGNEIWHLGDRNVLGITAVFFLIEKSAIYNQDPFENRPTDTPIYAIARTIDINLRQMLNEKELPAKATPEKFYLL